MVEFGTAVILAGGKSERMGFDKQLLKVNKELLISKLISKLRLEFNDILVITNNPEYYKDFNCRTAKDEIKNAGPLSGIYTGLKMSVSKYAYLIACDMPNANIDYIRYMKSKVKVSQADVCVTKTGDWIEPFNAFYSKRIISNIKSDLQENKGSVYYLIQKTDHIFIEENIARNFSPNWNMFLNLNTRDELERYITLQR